MEWITEYYALIVIAICLVAGIIMKNFMPTDNKWIPLTVTVLGILFACWALGGATPENVVKGAVSGLASTGLHQLFLQFINNKDKDKEA